MWKQADVFRKLSTSSSAESCAVRLILMRHGETLWNVERRLQGHSNSDLSERGTQQALSFAPFARALTPAVVVSSDLGRARQTASLIGCPDAPSDLRLREMDIGVWTGRTVPDLLAECPDEYAAWRAGRYTPDHAEPWDVFRDRVAAALQDWMRWSAGDVLAIVHEGVVRAALQEFLGLSPEAMVPITSGAATILSFTSAATSPARLEGYNIGPFLPDYATTE